MRTEFNHKTAKQASKWMKIACASVMALLFALPVAAQESIQNAGDEQNILEQISGQYEVAANRCSVFENEKLVSCGEEVKDQFSIQKLSSTTAKISFSSTQTNGHECSDEGVAELTNQFLRYCPSSPAYAGACLHVDISKSEFIFHLVNNKSDRDPFCGARATVDGLRFPRASRVVIPALKK